MKQFFRNFSRSVLICHLMTLSSVSLATNYVYKWKTISGSPQPPSVSSHFYRSGDGSVSRHYSLTFNANQNEPRTRISPSHNIVQSERANLLSLMAEALGSQRQNVSMVSDLPYSFGLFPSHWLMGAHESDLFFDSIHIQSNDIVYVNFGIQKRLATESPYQGSIILIRRWLHEHEQPTYRYQILVTSSPLSNRRMVTRILSNALTSTPDHSVTQYGLELSQEEFNEALELSVLQETATVQTNTTCCVLQLYACLAAFFCCISSTSR